MTVLLLVRHGQASFTADDYDVLSETGHEQARLLGAAFARRGITPTAVVRGGLRRHEETADGLVKAAGWDDVPVQVDPGWDEFDHDSVVTAYRPAYRDRLAAIGDFAAAPDPMRAFQEMFEAATDRWLAGEHDGDYTESFAAFGERVAGALGRAAAAHSGTVVVVTSGGPLSSVVSRLLVGDDSLWPRLNPVTVNSGVTKVISGRRGMTCVTVNAHEHLEHDRGLVTYR
ncbi:histidine phosphatase family protein [Streptomyces sp. NA04227]|uniref:histidine phosphatase family protein n=1 Tax=Streptomyces sp. NA04227 TaxID=2742136 RepID=UPI0015901CF9|nr:histidine phosphatase family protein [Streptomyces sp. NA04227]QKW06162.1 histidine phosphatase family protein [Streptomyces sp. NA04227]